MTAPAPLADARAADIDLAGLAADLRAYSGLQGKRDIAETVRAVGGGGASPIPVGDDTAAIPDALGFQLFACEGMLNGFVEAMPWFAGWSAVIVNLSDIAAMGGRPTAIVNALWAPDAARAAPILEGMRAAADHLAVPIVGGHSNLRTPQSQLAAAVLGRAKTLLTSFDAAPGDRLIAAIDLRGRYHNPHPFWDASTRAPKGRQRADLEILPDLAEAGLARAAKDISQGGLLGTAIMLLECSRVGAEITPAAIPCPEGEGLGRWLTAFPSFGFLIAAPAPSVAPILERFAARDIAAAEIGTVTAHRALVLTQGDQRELIWDIASDPLIGCAPGQTGHA